MLHHTSSAPRHLLEDIDILHQPREMLGRVLLSACDAMALNGITMSFGTFDELMDVNRANQDTWMPITTTFRPSEGGANETNGLVIFGRDTSGRVVTTHAVRLFDWSRSNLTREATALRLFYGDPSAATDAGEECFVKTDLGDIITGQCAYIGGLWCHPSVRGGGRIRLITAITRATALAQWGFDHLVGLVTPTNFDKNFHARTGMTNIAPKAVIMRNSPSLPGGDLEMTLAHLTAMQLIDNLFLLLQDLQTEVDTVVEQRRA